VLSALRAVGAQSAQDAQRLARIGIDPSRIRVTGNLKFDQPPTPPPGPIVAQLHERLAQAGAASHVIVAGSTHDGEETLLLQALIRCRRSHPHAVLVLAPRHPQRAAAIARTAKALGCAAVDLTELERSGGSRLPPVVIIDRLGLLQELYTLAQVAVVGGSLLPIHGIGGHNPLEPAACAKPILFGPHMDNFRPVARLLCASGAAFEVRGLEQLGDRLERLLAEPAAARHAGQAAAAVMTAHRGAVAASVELVLRVRTQRAESTTDPAGCGRGAVDSPARLCY
jgi:3-deoxy-D-manno-octulosonic-acid transferase